MCSGKINRNPETGKGAAKLSIPKTTAVRLIHKHS